MFIKRNITNENMTVRDAREYLAYLASMYDEYGQYFPNIDYENEVTGVNYDNASQLVDKYHILIELITERCGGAIGKIDFKVLQNYNSSEINQMIDNYLLDEIA